MKFDNPHAMSLYVVGSQSSPFTHENLILETIEVKGSNNLQEWQYKNTRPNLTSI